MSTGVAKGQCNFKLRESKLKLVEKAQFGLYAPFARR